MSTTLRTCLAVAVSCAYVSCATPLRLPASPGVPVQGDEAGFVYFDASRRPCSMEPLTAVAAIRGTIGTRAIDGRFSFAASVLRLRLESVGRTPRVFVFTAEEGREAFLYQGAYRFIGTSAEVIETILGLPLKAEDLRRVLTGCPRISGGLSGERFNDRWFKVRLDGETDYDVYARRDADGLGWSIQAIVGTIEGSTGRWRAEYQRDAAGRPQSVRVTSAGWDDTRGKGIDVTISFRNLRVDPVLAPETFRVMTSPSMPTADVKGLRSSRPASAPFLVDPRVK